jgi:hypothetical protein
MQTKLYYFKGSTSCNEMIIFIHFVPYAKSYEDSTFILILHHIQINVIPKYMLHVGTVKSMHIQYSYDFVVFCCVGSLALPKKDTIDPWRLDMLGIGSVRPDTH